MFKKRSFGFRFVEISKTVKVLISQVKTDSFYFLCSWIQTNQWESDVASYEASKPWIFFINGVLCFLNINGSGVEKEERWLETPLQGEDESRRNSPPYEAMDKSLKECEDEWWERERRCMKFCASNEVWTLKCISEMIKVKKIHIHGLYL